MSVLQVNILAIFQHMRWLQLGLRGEWRGVVGWGTGCSTGVLSWGTTGEQEGGGCLGWLTRLALQYRDISDRFLIKTHKSQVLETNINMLKKWRLIELAMFGASRQIPQSIWSIDLLISFSSLSYLTALFCWSNMMTYDSQTSERCKSDFLLQLATQWYDSPLMAPCWGHFTEHYTLEGRYTIYCVISKYIFACKIHLWCYLTLVKYTCVLKLNLTCVPYTFSK